MVVRSRSWVLASVAVLAGFGPAAAQVTAAPPAATITQAPPSDIPASPAPVPSVHARPSLVPQPGDTGNADEVVLPAKPALIVPGASSWDDGYKSLRTAFDRLEAEIAKDGLTANGRPIAIFTQTTDDSFKFDAMVPVEGPPAPAPTLSAEFRLGTTPSGQAYRFVHKGPYEDIDSTYETITAYLDAKDVVAKDAFIEEYLTDTKDAADPGLELNIFVQPK